MWIISHLIVEKQVTKDSEARDEELSTIFDRVADLKREINRMPCRMAYWLEQANKSRKPPSTAKYTCSQERSNSFGSKGIVTHNLWISCGLLFG
jgi:hypothetical protein